LKSISVNALKPNTVLSGAGYLDDHFILTSPETPVSEDLIRLLHAWGYAEIFSEDSVGAKTVMEPEADVTAGAVYQDGAEDAETMIETQKFYVSILDFTNKLFDTFLKRSVIPIEPLTEQVKTLIAVLKKNRRFLLRLGELDRGTYSYIVCHSVNVAILSVAVGDALKLPSHKLIELGMAGLLHELGMFKLPDTFQNANRPLTEIEKRALSAHPLLGYRVLKELGFPPNVTLAVLEHHEKENGTGYPQGLTGDKIAMSAKILAVASAYDAQIVSRPFRSARNGYASLVELLKESKQAYDENILRRMIFILSLYPIGSFVELKNGSLAVVHDANPDDPRHPDVKILTNEGRSPLTDFPIVKLQERQDLDIKRVLNSEEIQKFRADKILPA
jgi:HD-GYP domain-containing protein (c-di-GMP phosphodiesterase class II)